MTLADEVYSELILDHARRPRNHRVIDEPSAQVEGYNPLCGDKVTVYLRTDEKRSVDDIAFIGSGCAICIASASMMTEAVRGRSLDAAEELADLFQGCMIGCSDHIDDLPDKLHALLGVRAYPMRVKCATLPWHTLKQVIRESANAMKVLNDHE